jgi:hypothetical protein
VSSVTEAGETVVHTAVATANQYQYPQDAEILKYSAKYTWFVSAVSNDREIGTASVTAWFITPFVNVEGQTVSMEDLQKAITIVLGNFPGFEEFKDKVLASLADESGPITPERLLEIFNSYKILKVSVE